MSSYKKNLIFLLITLFFASCSVKQPEDEAKKNLEFVAVQTKEFEMEDFYIMYALEFENSRYYINAKDLYLKLFKATNKYEYLVNYSVISMQIGNFKDVKDKFLKYFIPNIKEEELLQRVYGFALLRLDELDSALNTALALVNKYESAINYELLATIYLEQKNYEKAVFYFDKSLQYDFLVNSLLNKTSIMFFDLKEQNKAIRELKKYLKQKDYDFNIAFQLVTFYADMKSNEDLKDLLEELYLKYKDEDDSLQINNTINLMVDYLDEEEIIEILEENRIENTFLLELYNRTNNYEKGYKLLDKLYKQSHNKDFLAQQAIVEFEMAEDKRAVLSSVINKFEIALEEVSNHIYQNYLAYLLIDFDLDVQKGLYLVNLALKQDPTNIAYIDTLAWGQYKIKNCIDAYKNMKQIVDEIGLEDKEIAFHWEKIKECK